MQQSRRLVLIRHAEAVQAAATDDQRELTEAGRRTAADAGGWLARTGVVPDRALVSSALRARQTWAEVAAAAGWDAAAEESPGLYTAEPDTVLDLVREDADATAVVVVGHNPTMASLAQLLDDGEGDQDAEQQLLTGGFPAGAVAVFEYDGEWADLGPATARVVAVRLRGS